MVRKKPGFGFCTDVSHRSPSTVLELDVNLDRVVKAPPSQFYQQ